jgi:GH24 family phage-related lysozyme (muramidase)
MATDLDFRAKLRVALWKHEGACDYFYRDSVGQVTIGVGHLVRHETDAAGLRLLHRSNGKSATHAELIAAFRAVKSEPFHFSGAKDHKMHVWGAKHYKNLAGASNIFMPQQEIDRLLDRHIDEFDQQLKRIFTVAHGYKREFDGFPENVRLALFDMIFNLGATNFPFGWPSLVRALKVENWQDAAKQSRRPQLSASRNQYVHDLLLAGDSRTGRSPSG